MPGAVADFRHDGGVSHDASTGPRPLGWVSVVGTLVTAGRLIARHWPVFLTAALVGIAFRNGIIWVAVAVSAVLPWLAQLVLILAPLGYLVPVVVMLRICGRDLPGLRAAMDAGDGGDRLVDIAVSILVPFLAVYTSYDLLRNDRQRFVNTTAADELFGSLGSAEGMDIVGRLQLGNPLWMIIAIVLVALIVRWLLGRVERIWRFVGLAFLGAFIELFWTIYVSEQLQRGIATVTNWIADRAVVVALVDGWHAFVDAIGWVGIPLDASVTWLFGLLAGFGPVIVVPIAWLVVASVVLGHRLMPPSTQEHALLAGARRYVPERLRAVGSSLMHDLGRRWAALFGGLGLVLRTGFVPILAFCVVFLVPNVVPTLVSWGFRLVLGSRDATTFLAFAPWEDAIGLTLQLVVTAPIVAAALELFIRPRRESAAATSTAAREAS